MAYHRALQSVPSVDPVRRCQRMEVVSEYREQLGQENKNGAARLVSHRPAADWEKRIIPARAILSVTKPAQYLLLLSPYNTFCY